MDHPVGDSHANGEQVDLTAARSLISTARGSLPIPRPDCPIWLAIS
jgi:hypothetical protein